MKHDTIIQSNSCSRPISMILYYDVDVNGKYNDNDEQINSALDRFHDTFPNGQVAYVRHKGERGESDHIHLICRNNTSKGFTNLSTIKNTVFYRISNVENDKYHLGEHIALAQVRQSNLVDWYGYALHSREYFDKIGKTFDKEYTYEYSDVKGDQVFIYEMQILFDDFLASHDDENFFVDYVEMMRQGATDYEVAKKVSKYITPDNMNSVLKGIDTCRRVMSTDTDDLTKAFNLLEPYIRNNSCLSDNLIGICIKQYRRDLSFNEIAFALFTKFLKNLTSKDILDLLSEM